MEYLLLRQTPHPLPPLPRSPRPPLAGGHPGTGDHQSPFPHPPPDRGALLPLGCWQRAAHGARSLRRQLPTGMCSSALPRHRRHHRWHRLHHHLRRHFSRPDQSMNAWELGFVPVAVRRDVAAEQNLCTGSLSVAGTARRGVVVRGRSSGAVPPCAPTRPHPHRSATRMALSPLVVVVLDADAARGLRRVEVPPGHVLPHLRWLRRDDARSRKAGALTACRRTISFGCAGCLRAASAADCKRPRSPSSSSSAGHGGRRIIRAQHVSSPTPPGSEARGRTPPSPPPSPPTPRGATGETPNFSPPRFGRHGRRQCPGFPSEWSSVLLAGFDRSTSPNAAGSSDAIDPRDEYENLGSGHPALRPWNQPLFISRDAEMDAEEARLRVALLAATPHGLHGVGLEAARAAVLGLPGTADDGLIVWRFVPESFLFVFSSQQPMEAALRAREFVAGTTRFIFRRWTRPVHADAGSLYRRVLIEIEGVPAHAWSWRVARKILDSSCWIESMDAASESKTDMTKIAVTAWCHEPSRIPHARTLIIAEHEDPVVANGGPSLHDYGGRRYSYFEPRPPQPPAGGSSTRDINGDEGEDGGPSRTLPRVRTFVCHPGTVDGQPARGAAGSVVRGRRAAALPTSPMYTAAAQLKPSLQGHGPADAMGGPPPSCDNAVRPVAACTAAAEWVPVELQCARPNIDDIIFEDPMRAEGSGFKPSSPAVQKAAAVRDPLVTPRPTILHTYKRRAKEDRAKAAGHAAALAPTRLAFEDEGAEGSNGPRQDSTWIIATPRSRASPRPNSPAQCTPPRSNSNPGLVGRAIHAASPAGESSTDTSNSPATDAAIAATSAFLAGITLATRSPLIRDLPGRACVPIAAVAAATPSLRRSSRLAGQPLNISVRPSKKGEILAMKRLGFLHPGNTDAANINDAQAKFDHFFNAIVDVKNFQALRDLFPAARGLSDEELLAAAQRACAMVDDSHARLTIPDEDKLEFLYELRTIRPNSACPWIIAGHFSLLLEATYKNKRNINIRNMGRFRRFVDDMELKDTPLHGRRYTWSNEQSNPTLEKLDRVLVSTEWEALFPSSFMQALSSDMSDHAPLHFATNALPQPKRRFHFESWWLRVPGHTEAIARAWHCPDEITNPYTWLDHLLRQTARQLQSWSQTRVGLVKEQLIVARELVLRFDRQMERRQLTDDEVSLRRELKLKVLALASLERTIARLRSCIIFLKDGDANTKLFHLQCSHRARKKHIAVLEWEGVTAINQHEKADILYRYFSEAIDPTTDRPMRINLAAIGVPPTDLSHLDAPFTEEEVWSTIKNLPKEKSPGPDGFTAEFYIAAWGIIKGDIMRAFDFFYATNRGQLHRLNGALVTLLPKRVEAKGPGDYRPISLIHSFAKLVAKVLANRLAPSLHGLVDINQSAFIKSRSIHDNFKLVELATKALHKAKKASLLLKLDISKAFDTVDWSFLLHVLEAMGFGTRWRNWISALISTSSTCIILNGEPGRRITNMRGLRQGDPLSPMLFILVMEILHRLFTAAKHSNVLAPPAIQSIHHQCSIYADDVMLFITPTRQDLITTREVLHFFGNASGLRTNLAKCQAAPIACTNEEVALVEHLLPVPITTFPMTYLGLPLSVTALRKSDLQPMIDKVVVAMPTWKSSLMNKAGRLTTYGGLGIQDMKIAAYSLRLRWLWLKRTDRNRPWKDLELAFGNDPVVAIMFQNSVDIQLGDGALALTVAQALANRTWISDIKGRLTIPALEQLIYLWHAANQCHLSPGTEDTFRWRWTSSGTYSARSAYRQFFLPNHCGRHGHH
ncbi:hypothetical protein HU200_048128 [Digitaria exilis]|uniref:Reverse transcriptase domain-containing protein n=1 Tax=Digitaria exilis TaxID=1010633 RepID=A0A835AWN0_9POAL|nr:hypothetical protein HU200_048128 [Digitaria exilis]